MNEQDDEIDKKGDFGQDFGQDHNDRSCPKNSIHTIPKSLTKTDYGQDLNPFVDPEEINSLIPCEYIQSVESAENAENENMVNNKDRSCPKTRVFDSMNPGQDDFFEYPLDPVREQKTLDFEESEEEDIRKKLSGCELMRTDLKNFAKSRYNRIVQNIPVFVGEFNKRYPGYKQQYGLEAVLSNADRLSKRGWE